MKIIVHVEYGLGNEAEIDLIDKDWKDVKEHWIKWDILNVIFNNDPKVYTYDLNTVVDIDMKRPDFFEISVLKEEDLK